MDKKKQYCVHVEVEGQTADFKIQGDSLIPLEKTEEEKAIDSAKVIAYNACVRALESLKQDK